MSKIDFEADPSKSSKPLQFDPQFRSFSSIFLHLISYYIQPLKRKVSIKKKVGEEE